MQSAPGPSNSLRALSRIFHKRRSKGAAQSQTTSSKSPTQPSSLLSVTNSKTEDLVQRPQCHVVVADPDESTTAHAGQGLAESMPAIPDTFVQDLVHVTANLSDRLQRAQQDLTGAARQVAYLRFRIQQLQTQEVLPPDPVVSEDSPALFE